MCGRSHIHIRNHHNRAASAVTISIHITKPPLLITPEPLSVGIASTITYVKTKSCMVICPDFSVFDLIAALHSYSTSIAKCPMDSIVEIVKIGDLT